ncbi:MAG: glycosyltransferase family 2 protein [Streptosporangiales bacterium]
MATISIITPVYGPEPSHLVEAYESIASQELPDGWSLEWLVQEDGQSGVAQEILPDHDWIIHGTGRRGGVAICRNLALSRARGELIKNFDQDDVFTPGVLRRDIDVLSTESDVQWTTSRVLDLLPDGSTEGFPNDPPAGRLAPGVVREHWRTHDYRLPVHPTTMCVRRPLVVALGGWMAVPGSDDTGLLVAASMISTGWFSSEVGLLYRKWPGQVTASETHTEPVEWHARMQLIDQRAEELARTPASS